MHNVAFEVLFVQFVSCAYAEKCIKEYNDENILLFIIELSIKFSVSCKVVFVPSAQCRNQFTMPYDKWLTTSFLTVQV